MAVDYIINYDCVPKQQLGGLDGFLQILKYVGYAQVIREMIRNEPDGEVTEETKFGFMRVGARGTEQGQEQLSVLDMEERGKAIDRYAEQCSQCPANVFGCPGGCSGAVNYPISAESEEWLLVRLPESLEDSIRGSLLKSFLKDFSRNGRAADMSRGDARCYELRKAPVRTWGRGLFGTTKCTSSVILGNLYGVGELQPLHGAMMGYLLGAMDQPPTTDRRLSPQWVLNTDQLPEDGSIRQIASMLQALHRAYELNVTTYVDA